jgi:hypothetical protein
MNVQTIQKELCRRLATIVDTAYPSDQANPVHPCAIVNFPTVQSFHTDIGHGIVRLTFEIEMHAGRGDTNDAADQLATWLGTDDDNARSVLRVLEAKDPQNPAPWLRLAVRDTSGLSTSAESLSITFTIDIDSQ